MKKMEGKRKSYRKTNVYPFLNRVYKLLETKPEMFVLRKMRIQGECDYIEDIITIDPRKEVLSTVCHEILHYLHPAWSERTVIQAEHRIMNNMTIRQLKTFLKKFTNIL